MPQIQIPDFEGHNLERERLRQNAMAMKSNLVTQGLQQNRMGMINQDMVKEMQDRQELEVLLGSTPPEQRERAGLEFLRVRDPEKAAKLEAEYLSRWITKGKVDPKGASAELERATGEKVTVGKRYGTIKVGENEVTIDLLTGQQEPVNNAQAVARIQADREITTTAMAIKGRKDLETHKAGLPKTDNSLTNTELFAKDPRQFEAMKETEARIGAKYRKPDRSDRPSAAQEIQLKRLRKSIKDKKDRALTTLEREYRSPAAFGRFEPMSDEELLNRKQQVQTDFEDDLNAAGFEASPFNYSDRSRSSQLSTGHPETGGITREQALQELRRRGVVR